MVCASFSFVNAQTGTQVDYEDNLGATILEYNGLINGKHSYEGSEGGDIILISWSDSNSRWEITCCSGVLIAHSTISTAGINPPNSDVGGYVIDDPASGFVIVGGSGTTDIVLPVDLLSFEIFIQGKNVVLKWQTGIEINNEKFEIEASRNGVSFKKIGEVPGKISSAALNDYSFPISQPFAGGHYFRLKQFDIDGKYEYSEVVSIPFNESYNSIGQFYPNPSKSGWVDIDFSNDDIDRITVYAFDVTGQLVSDQIMQFEDSITNFRIDFSHLDQGVYFIQLGDSKNPIYRKLIIE